MPKWPVARPSIWVLAVVCFFGGGVAGCLNWPVFCGCLNWACVFWGGVFFGGAVCLNWPVFWGAVCLNWPIFSVVMTTHPR